MINKEFLKTLTVLYVEDEDLAREKLATVLQRFFKNVITAENGEVGYHKFQAENFNNNIDLILSDINMPKMSGIEMLEKIRESNKEIPIIYTTARTESEYLLKAIELNASHYIIKPIDIEVTITRIQEVCEKKYYQNLVKQKNAELEQYSGILDNVAGVFKLNSNKEIIFINPLLLDNLEDKEENIKGRRINTLFHREMSSTLIDEIWAIVKKGATWQGNIKFYDSKGNFFYLNTTIFQIINDEGFEYVGIGFISTQEVEEKREFHKKVIENMKNANIKNFEINKKIRESDEIVEKYKRVIIELKQQIKAEREKVAINKGQLQHFENELSSSNTNMEKILGMKNKEVTDLKEMVTDLRSESNVKVEQMKELELKITAGYKEIAKKEDEIRRKQERISSLNDLLAHRESQLRKINPELLL